MQAYLKAVYGALVAGLTATATAYTAGNGHIGYQAIIVIVTAIVVAFGAVWGVPNTPAAKPTTPPAG